MWFHEKIRYGGFFRGVLKFDPFMFKITTILFLIALSVLAGVHLLALRFFLYWHYPWLDLPMHVLGGSVVALSTFAFSNLHVPGAYLVPVSVIRVMSVVVVVVIAWEVFEVWAGVTMVGNYWLDTSLDIIFGLLGGLTGYFVAKRVHAL